MRITSKGQVTIPADLRAQAGLLPQTEVEFTFDGSAVRLSRAAAPAGRGAATGWSPSCADAGMSR